MCHGVSINRHRQKLAGDNHSRLGIQAVAVAGSGVVCQGDGCPGGWPCGPRDSQVCRLGVPVPLHYPTPVSVLVRYAALHGQLQKRAHESCMAPRIFAMKMMNY